MPEWLDKLLKRKPGPKTRAVSSEDTDLETFFTGMEHLRGVFHELVTAPTLPKRLLVIHGVGGVGKSTLLRMYRLYCKRRGVPVALVGGEEIPSPVAALASWAGDLREDKLAFPTFQPTLTQYYALQAKVEAQAREADLSMVKAAGKLGQIAVEMGASTIPIPAVGPVAGAFVDAGAGALVDWLRGFLSRPEIELYRDPVTRLTQDFVNDLTTIVEKRRPVLMLDTYEQMAGFDDWVRGLVQQLPPNVLVVIAGREPLGAAWDRAWPGWMAHARIEALEEMDQDDVHTLVRRYYATQVGGEPDPAQVDEIVRFARGLPLVVTSAVRLWVRYGMQDFCAVKPQVVADLVDRLMEGTPRDMRPTLEAAAALRWFNKSLLRELLPAEQVDQVYDELRRFPFVRSRAEGLALHDVVREMLDESLQAHDPEQHQALHEKAATYFETRLAGTTGDERERLTLELLYHRLQADEGEGIALLEQLFEEAKQLGQRERQDKLLDEASRHSFRERRRQYRFRYLEARASKDWRQREARCKVLLAENLGDPLRLRVLRALADPLAYQGKKAEIRPYLGEALAISERLGNLAEVAWTRLYLCWQVGLDESRDHIEQAIAIFREIGDEQGLAGAEMQSGWDYLNRWQPAAARESLSRGLAIEEKLNDRLNAAFLRERIGQAYLIEGDLQRAIAYKEQALRVFEELQDEWNIAWTLDELATCYSWTGQWALTLALLERAQAIFAGWGDYRETACVVRRASIYHQQGRLALAWETYQQALHTMPRHGSWTTQENYAGLGHIHLARGELDEALTHYQLAIQEFEVHGNEIEVAFVGPAYLGALSLAQGCVADALEHYAASSEAARAAHNYLNECLALVGMCQAHYKQGNPDQLEALVEQAEELGDRYRYYQFLADLYVIQGHVALDRAIAGQACRPEAVSLYHTALGNALLYNRYKLDETVQTIVAHCLGQGEEGTQVLATLRDVWQTGITDEGISLLEAERLAREREPGDGSPQQTVTERIDAALATASESET